MSMKSLTEIKGIGERLVHADVPLIVPKRQTTYIYICCYLSFQGSMFCKFQCTKSSCKQMLADNFFAKDRKDAQRHSSC